MYVDLSADCGKRQVELSKSPDANRQYVVRVESEPTRMEFVNCLLCGYLRFRGKPWLVQNLRTGAERPLPMRAWIFGFQKCRDFKLLLTNTTCVVTPVLVYTHEQVKRRQRDGPPIYDGLLV